MEGLVKIIEEKCKICYACVRACPVSAIKVTNEDAFPKIVPERCIACGSCIKACKPGAILYESSIEDVKSLLSSGITTAVAVDPSISAEFSDINDYRRFVQMIRALGFKYVVETSFAVDLLAIKYLHLVENFKGKYYIFANDPVVNSYIEKFQPELIHNLARLKSPAQITAGIIRKKYGENISVVNISPIIASKKKNEKGAGIYKLDAVITFSELRDLFIEFKIDQKQMEYSEFDPPLGNKGILFPMADGILQAAGISNHLLEGNVTTVEGEAEMKESLKEFHENGSIINSHFNIFYNEFLLGPGTTKGGERYIRQAAVVDYAKRRLKKFNIAGWNEDIEEFSDLDFSRVFRNNDQRLPFPGEEKISEIMRSLKKDVDENLTCGVCGYNSCRDFAIAIGKGLATREMCNSYTSRNRQEYIQSLKISNDKLAKAERALRDSEAVAKIEKEAAKDASEITTTMLQKLPSALVIMNEKLRIIQANQSFIDLLGEDAREINDVIPGLVGADLKTLLPYNIYNLFTYVFGNNENIQNKDIIYNGKQLTASVFIIRNAKIAGAVFRDMFTAVERRDEVINRVNEVIDKNLSMVQQIGFLLGEGASETEKMLHSIKDFYKDRNKKS
ncbi:MAG: 4Fe-4S binding protein [Bacteroidales bacterium]|nr:4Fe-4S binding protein [Bacteroidales bacterium]MCF8390489.1 4Fe-4S binding protein [Bacteroidales bacterium]